MKKAVAASLRNTNYFFLKMQTPGARVFFLPFNPQSAGVVTYKVSFGINLES